MDLLYADLFTAAHTRARLQPRPANYFKIWDNFTHGWVESLDIPSMIEQYLGADLGSVLDEVFEEFEASNERLQHLVNYIQVMTSLHNAQNYLAECDPQSVQQFDLLELSRLLVALTTVNGVYQYQKFTSDTGFWLRQWRQQCYLHNLKHKQITELIQQKSFYVHPDLRSATDVITHHTRKYQESNSLSMAAAAFTPFASYYKLTKAEILNQLIQVTRWFNPLYRLLSDIPFDITEPMNIGFLIYITEETIKHNSSITIDQAKQQLKSDLDRQQDLNQKQAQQAKLMIQRLQKRLKSQNKPLVTKIGAKFLGYAQQHLHHHLTPIK